MEDVVIKENLCNFCMNKNKNCMVCVIEQDKNTKKYRCNNYKRDYNMPSYGYTEKWIDNLCLIRGHLFR